MEELRRACCILVRLTDLKTHQIVCVWCLFQAEAILNILFAVRWCEVWSRNHEVETSGILRSFRSRSRPPSHSKWRLRFQTPFEPDRNQPRSHGLWIMTRAKVGSKSGQSRPVSLPCWIAKKKLPPCEAVIPIMIWCEGSLYTREILNFANV